MGGRGSSWVRALIIRLDLGGKFLSLLSHLAGPGLFFFLLSSNVLPAFFLFLVPPDPLKRTLRFRAELRRSTVISHMLRDPRLPPSHQGGPFVTTDESQIHSPMTDRLGLEGGFILELIVPWVLTIIELHTSTK